MSHTGTCYHCSEPVTTGDKYRVLIDDAWRAVCCPGCQAVAELIRDSGLADFYRFRTAPSVRPDAVPGTEDAAWLAFDRDEVQRGLVSTTSDGMSEAGFIIEGVRCAACGWLIERTLGSLPGMGAVRINPATAHARFQWDPGRLSLSRILAAVARLGYRPHPMTAGTMESVAGRERRQAMKRLAVAGLGMMQVMTYAVALYAGAFQGMDSQIRDFLRLVSLLVATPVVIYSGAPFFVGAWRDLAARRPGMDVPVALAIGGAYTASLWNGFTGQGEVYFDSVTMFVFLLSLGRFAEMLARHRAGASAEALAQLMPATTRRLVPGSDTPETVGVAELEPGDRVLVAPGEPFPADGDVAAGSTRVDESMLTGESRARARDVGDRVVGGSLNVGSPVEVTIRRTGQDTVISHITRLLQRAQADRPQLALTADRVARWFVTGVLLTAAAVGATWYALAPDRAFEVVLSVLVVTCPCALSLATPAALTAATSALARQGLLVTRGAALENLAAVDHVVLDKTGTLTRGMVQRLATEAPGRLEKDAALSVAAALERGSEHPIALAFGDVPVPERAVDVEVAPGRGIEGTVAGRRYRIGTPEWAAPRGVAVTEAGGTRVVLADADEVLGIFTLSDELRPGTRESLAALAKRGVGMEIASGDSEAAVAELAERVGVSRWSARLLPDDKLARIRELQDEGHTVAMVGDGINDAPVLAGANVSVALASGTPLAQTSADMVLLGESLHPLGEGLEVARRTRGVIAQNLTWAASYNLVALPLAATGLVAPWMAAIGMSLSSLLVVLNALRLTRGQAAETPPARPALEREEPAA